jgi:hypothetical protein
MAYSIGVSIPSPECRRRRWWKISRYSKIALTSSSRVRHLPAFLAGQLAQLFFVAADAVGDGFERGALHGG